MKQLAKKLIIASLIGFQVQASPTALERETKIKILFNDIKKMSKGALDQNTYQTATGRTLVMQNGIVTSPPKDTLLTVAFRSTKAKELAELDFYVGNRYGSNYWELNNKYLATPMEQTNVGFHLSPNDLKMKNEALPMSLSLAKHQMLELYYMGKNPTSLLTKSYLQRGVADADNELKYYRLFADYLAANIKTETDYLVYIEFQKKSNMLPGKKTISLSAIRQLVADISTKLDSYFPTDKAATFRSLRNSIHNGMNKSVLVSLSDFQSVNSALILPEDLISYEALKTQIASFYKIDKDILTVLLPAIKTDIPESVSIINSLKMTNNSLESLLSLSALATTARQKFYVTKNIDLTHLIIRTQEFIDAELGNLNFSTATDIVLKAKMLVNMSYAMGLMSQSRLNEITDRLSTSTNSALTAISSALSEAVSKFENAFQPALNDWKLVSTSVASFVDDSIRSSSLIGLDATLTQLKSVSLTATIPTSTVVKPAVPVSAPNTSTMQPPPIATALPIVQPMKPISEATLVIENPGVGYGYLIFVPRLETEKIVPTLSYKMIPIFETLPLDLGVIAGVITEEPQTPLSHVNIKSKNRGTPNVYMKNASQDGRIQLLLKQKALVRFELKNGEVSIRQVPLSEAQAFWGSANDKKPEIKLRADLTEKRIRSTAEMGFKDVISVGAKAANYSEGTHILPSAFRPGFAIPFYYYREFIRTNTMDGTTSIEQYITQLVQNPRIKTDKAFLVDALTKLQARMTDESLTVNKDLIAQVKTLVTAKYPGQKIRFRSSTNSEDMPQFTGAGLYDSAAYDPAKPTKTIDKALRYVWASVWNLRAFEERDLFKINHLDVSMAMLVSPAYPNEIANGVGVSRNILKPELGPGFYLNIQSGSDAVTNPDPSITPDQVLVLKKKDPKTGTKYTLIYTKISSKTKDKPVLPYEEVEKIADYLQVLQDHFIKIYHPKNDNPNFSLDVEFKVDYSEGAGTRKVHYKQARPFVGQ
ncbi:MAG: PEP/pyruvate-binding domain-containing protein [Pseudobdellovibrio sp.]